MRMNKNGETLIIVIIVAAVILIIGGAVMMFSSNNLADSNKQAQDKESYYVAKSVGNVLTESMEKGSLGKNLKNKVLQDLKSRNTVEKVEKNWNISPVSMSFRGSEIENFKIDNVSISFSSNAQATSGAGASLAQASVSINNLIVSYTVTDENEVKYKLNIKYAYTGWYDVQSDVGKWSNEVWKVIDTTN